MINLTPILQVAFDILRKTKAPLHVNDIAEIAIQSNSNMGMNAVDLAKKLASALAQNLKTSKPAFAKVQNKNGSFKKGIYRARLINTALPPPPPPPPPKNNLYTGKAGEHAVMGELLFWGFNVSLMAVDQGIDIIASKDNKYFHIQVKTTYPDENGKCSFSIKKQSFDENAGSSTFFIFVMRGKEGNKFIAIPSGDIENQKRLGIIKGEDLPVHISYEKTDKKYKLNSKYDVTIYLNNFAQIK